LGRDIEVEPAVLAELADHVVEERQSGVDGGLAAVDTVDVQRHVDRRLGRATGAGGGTCHGLASAVTVSWSLLVVISGFTVLSGDRKGPPNAAVVMRGPRRGR